MRFARLFDLEGGVQVLVMIVPDEVDELYKVYAITNGKTEPVAKYTGLKSLEEAVKDVDGWSKSDAMDFFQLHACKDAPKRIFARMIRVGGADVVAYVSRNERDHYGVTFCTHEDGIWSDYSIRGKQGYDHFLDFIGTKDKDAEVVGIATELREKLLAVVYP